MKNNEASIFVFIASIIIGILIALNINLKGTSRSFQMSAKQYQDAYNQKNKLYAEVSNLKDSNSKMSDKINKYKYDDTKNQKLTQDIDNEFNDNNMEIGFSAVKGNGVKLVINDGTIDDPKGYEQENTQLILLKTLHDDDMIKVVNELRVAGAEAISINGQRVLPNTEILCSWAFLRINGHQIPAPFEVTAIGDPDTLDSTLQRDDGFIRSLINRGIQVDITKENNLKIDPYIGDISYNNLTPKTK
jgi:uncharacterized protein YlxW (UPF0749 family)